MHGRRRRGVGLYRVRGDRLTCGNLARLGAKLCKQRGPYNEGAQGGLNPERLRSGLEERSL